MKQIVSGTSTERIVRSLIAFLLIAGFAAAFLWDGYWGYARKNKAELTRVLGATTTPLPMVKQLSAEEARLIASDPKSHSLNELTQRLGEPAFRVGDSAYFVGRGGWLKASVQGDRVIKLEWIDGPHSETDQNLQRILGVLLAAIGLISLIHLIRVLNTRAIVSESGLTFGPRTIPWDAIRGVTADPNGRAGVVVLGHVDGAGLHQVRLDPYVYSRLPEIVSQICEIKGSPHPFSGQT